MKRNFLSFALCLLLIFSFLLSSPQTTYASSYSDGLPDLSTAKNVYLESLDHDTILVNKNPNVDIAPASTVKLMTAMLALDHFSGKEETPIVVTAPMVANAMGTSMRLSDGDVIKAADLIYAVLCGGFNDAAYVLAYAVSGSIHAFVDLMNQKAVELGAKSTIYSNPTGYDSATMKTTLRDTVLIAKEAMKSEKLLQISSALSHKITFISDKEDLIIHNRNGLIGTHYFDGYQNPYATGMISGNTDLGGWCAVTKLTVKGADYLCIVMGGEDNGGMPSSYELINKLTAYVRLNLTTQTPMRKGDRVCAIPVEYALKGTSSVSGYEIDAVIAEDAELFLPVTAESGEVTRKYYLYEETLVAPVFKGQQVGSVDFYYNEKLLKTIPLVLDDSVEANDFALALRNFREAVFSRGTLIFVILFFSQTLIYLMFFDKKKRKPTRTLAFKDFK